MTKHRSRESYVEERERQREDANVTEKPADPLSNDLSTLPNRVNQFASAIEATSEGAYEIGAQQMRIDAMTALLAAGMKDAARVVLALPTPTYPERPQ